MSGNDAGPSSGGKARKFKPTIPSRRKKAEGEGPNLKSENDDTFKDLMRAAQEPANWQRTQQRRVSSKVAAPEQVVFGGSQSGGFKGPTPGGKSGPAIVNSAKGKANGVQPKPALKKSESSQGKSASGSQSKPRIKSEPFLNEDKKDRQNLVQPPSLEEDEEDKDLFNYDAYYPTSLPLRRPGESAELAQTSNLDEELLHENREHEDVAEALGLFKGHDESGPADVLLQFPSVLPSAVKENKNEPLDRRRRLTTHEKEPKRQTAYSLNQLPPGKIGKLIIFDSGKVKLKLGDVLLDVSLGSECQCFQQVVAIHMKEKSAVTLGEIQHKAVCTPDMDQLLSDKPTPEWEFAEPRSPVRSLPNQAEPSLLEKETNDRETTDGPVPMDIDKIPSKANGTQKASLVGQVPGRAFVFADSDDDI